MAEETNAPTGQEGQPQNPASQQPGAGEPDGPKNEPTGETVSRAELDKVIGERQSAKEARRAAEELAAELNTKLAGMPDSAELGQFQEWKQKQADAARDKAIKTGDVDAIAKQAREPLLQENTGLKDRVTRMATQLESTLCRDALRKAATDAGAVNPDQVVTLLQGRVTMAENGNGAYLPQFVDAVGARVHFIGDQAVSMDNFVRSFLVEPTNANLVRSTANPGSGAQPQGGGSKTEGTPGTLSDFANLPDDQKLKAAMEMTPEQKRTMLGMQTAGTEGFF